eukprot:1161472-Pelagomonas_calceolata.AAC.12
MGDGHQLLPMNELPICAISSSPVWSVRGRSSNMDEHRVIKTPRRKLVQIWCLLPGLQRWGINASMLPNEEKAIMVSYT